MWFLHSRSRAGGYREEVAEDTDVAMGMVFHFSCEERGCHWFRSNVRNVLCIVLQWWILSLDSAEFGIW